MISARTKNRGRAAVRGIRVVLDARPLQVPARNPTTATYLHELLRAFAGATAGGDSFLFLLDTPGPDPSTRYPGLPFAGRRRLPPTRRLRAASLTLDPFLLRAISMRATLGVPRRGLDVRPVLHVTGGTLPIASGVPMVVTLLDLAAWELPAVYQRSVAERFGQRLRVRLLRQAERLIVASEATARAASRFLPFPRERIHVIRLAPTLPRASDASAAVDGGTTLASLRERLGVPERYVLFRAQYDGRKDVPTLLRAMAAASERAAAGSPNLVMVLPSGELDVSDAESDRAALRRLVERHGAGDVARVLPPLTPGEDAAILAGARALVHPALVEGSGLPVIDALAAGVPVIATNVGAVGELVGKAGILVPPRDAGRLAAALGTIWSDERVHGRLARAATKQPAAARTWLEVARETRAVYALASLRRRA